MFFFIWGYNPVILTIDPSHRRFDPFAHQFAEVEASWESTWRIIPVSKWLVTIVSKSPKWGYSPYEWPEWLINGGY